MNDRYGTPVQRIARGARSAVVSNLIDQDTRFKEILGRLTAMSIEDYYNPYRKFDWPETLPADMWWMSPDLMTIDGTDMIAELDDEQLYRLSRHESINFYSLNVHGIRELIIEVISRIHTSGYETPSEFFHHFIGEENEHMWFFAEFCLRYGGKIYRQPPTAPQSNQDPESAAFLVFARILLFEELVDYFNSRMADDDTLHETIRHVNRIHHQDESRHIAFGRELVSLLYADLKKKATAQSLREIETYLKRYLVYSFESLYSPQVYRDAGIADPLALRRRLLAAPVRAEREQRMLRKPLGYLTRTGILGDRDLSIVR
jgi:hypothetical protein